MTTDFDRFSYWRGVRDGLPFILVVGPFALLFGVVATEAGLSLFETMTFAITVVAGAAQFTALQLMSENAPTLVVIASALAVNLRLAMYSASLTPHLGALPMWRRARAPSLLGGPMSSLASARCRRQPALDQYFTGKGSVIWHLLRANSSGTVITVYRCAKRVRTAMSISTESSAVTSAPAPAPALPAAASGSTAPSAPSGSALPSP